MYITGEGKLESNPGMSQLVSRDFSIVFAVYMQLFIFHVQTRGEGKLESNPGMSQLVSRDFSIVVAVCMQLFIFHVHNRRRKTRK